MSTKVDMTDFDVGNYPVEDLLSIMGVLNKIPLSKADIIDITESYIIKYDKDPLFKKFFFDIRKRLLNASSKITFLCSEVFIFIGSTDLILNGSIIVFNYILTFKIMLSLCCYHCNLFYQTL